MKNVSLSGAQQHNDCNQASTNTHYISTMSICLSLCFCSWWLKYVKRVMHCRAKLKVCCFSIWTHDKHWKYSISTFRLRRTLYTILGISMGRSTSSGVKNVNSAELHLLHREKSSDGSYLTGTNLDVSLFAWFAQSLFPRFWGTQLDKHSNTRWEIE